MNKPTNTIDTSIIHDLAYHLEINDYLKDYEIYNNYDDYYQKAICCNVIYDNFIDEAMKHDLYLVPDYFNHKKEEIKNILQKLE